MLQLLVNKARSRMHRMEILAYELTSVRRLVQDDRAWESIGEEVLRVRSRRRRGPRRGRWRGQRRNVRHQRVHGGTRRGGVERPSRVHADEGARYERAAARDTMHWNLA